MIDLQVLEKNEQELSGITRGKFSADVKLSEDAIELLLGLVQTTAEQKAVSTRSHSGYSVFILANRMIRTLRCAHDSILKGYYDVAMGVLRFAFETHLLMNYLKDRDDEATRWLNGKTFQPAYLKSKVKPSYHEVYSLLSAFAHPNVSACRGWFLKDIGNEQFEFTICEFMESRFLYAEKHLIAIEFATIALVSVEFAMAFSENKPILNRLRKWVTQYRKRMIVINDLLESARASLHLIHDANNSVAYSYLCILQRFICKRMIFQLVIR